MMDAPKRIYAWATLPTAPLVGTWSVTRYPDDAQEYTLAAEHDRIVAEKDAEIAAARDKALDDAARMVDCACECRDAVLAAKTKVERWNACGRDPCGALDAADIRAMKGGGGNK